MIIGNKVQWFIYAISFALYGLVKSLIERGRSMGTEYCIKLVFANIVFAIMYFVLKSFLTEVQYMSVLFVGLNATFLIYDLFYSQFKLVFANIVFAIMYFVLKSFLTEVQYMSVLFVGLNATFLIYDLFYSQFIRMYENKLRKNISKYLD